MTLSRSAFMHTVKLEMLIAPAASIGDRVHPYNSVVKAPAASGMSRAL